MKPTCQLELGTSRAYVLRCGDSVGTKWCLPAITQPQKSIKNTLSNFKINTEHESRERKGRSLHTKITSTWRSIKTLQLHLTLGSASQVSFTACRNQHREVRMEFTRLLATLATEVTVLRPTSPMTFTNWLATSARNCTRGQDARDSTAKKLVQLDCNFYMVPDQYWIHCLRGSVRKLFQWNKIW